MRSRSRVPGVRMWTYLLGSLHSTLHGECEGWTPTPRGFLFPTAVYLQMDTKGSRQGPKQTASPLHCPAPQSFACPTPSSAHPAFPGSLTVPPEMAQLPGWGHMGVISRIHVQVGSVTLREPSPPRRADKGLIIRGDEKDTDGEILIQAKVHCFFFMYELCNIIVLQ